jgi:hypothetical protein
MVERVDRYQQMVLSAAVAALKQQTQKRVGCWSWPLVQMPAYPLALVHLRNLAYLPHNEVLALMLDRHRFCAIVRLGLMSLLAYLPVA